MKEQKDVKEMKIIKIDDEKIVFDNGSFITFSHDQDCCEYNYADFMQLRDTDIENETFNTNLIFEKVDGSGFRFGNLGKMYFVPCYSEQNGYYSTDIDIEYHRSYYDVDVINLDCELL